MKGRPKKRIPYGTLPCTLGGHLAPHEDFPRKKDGTIDSWCRHCRHLRDHLVATKKAMIERKRGRPVLRLPHRPDRRAQEVADAQEKDCSCPRYPQD